MRKFLLLATVSAFGLTGGLVWAQKAASARRPTPVLPPAQMQQESAVVPMAVSNYSVTPATVTFTSSNPSTSAAGSATTTVRFRTSGLVAPNNTWRLWIQASAASFTGCNAPPAGGVTVTCASVSTGMACVASGATLSPSAPPAATEVASGTGNHNPNTVTVTYTFQDGWNYQVGTGCSLGVSYIYTSP